MNSLMLYSGYVQHTRSKPRPHSFKYKADSIWLDLQRLELLDDISPFWSSRGFNLIRFDRDQYLPSELSLYDQVCHEIKHRADEDFKGQVYLLANLSCWGHCFNPISFFACYENEVLKYLLAEVHNTPWNERVVYLHQIDHEQELGNADVEQCVEFEKQLHVSPFMPMDLKYLWRYKLNKDRFKISMTLRQNDQAIFNASLNLFSQPLTKAKASQLPFFKPFMTLSVLPRIYWQAFKLWLKKVPTYQHPAK